MQTKINVKQAFGLVGELYDLTPYRVDAKTVAATATFGKAAGRSSTGTYADMDSSTYTTFAGVFVRPKEAITSGANDSNSVWGALNPTMAVAAGTVMQIASMGDMICEVSITGTSTSETETTEAAAKAAAKTAAETAAAAAAAKAGASLYVTSAGKLTTVSSGNTLIGTIIADIEAGTDGNVIGTPSATGEGTSWTGSCTYEKKQIVAIRIG